MVFSGCGSKTEKIADAEKKNPDTIILLDEGKEISMAILDTKGKTIKEFEDISYADAISEAMDMSGNIIVEPQYEGAASNSAMEDKKLFMKLKQKNSCDTVTDVAQGKIFEQHTRS